MPPKPSTRSVPASTLKTTEIADPQNSSVCHRDPQKSTSKATGSKSKTTNRVAAAASAATPAACPSALSTRSTLHTTKTALPKDASLKQSTPNEDSCAAMTHVHRLEAENANLRRRLETFEVVFGELSGELDALTDEQDRATRKLTSTGTNDAGSDTVGYAAMAVRAASLQRFIFNVTAAAREEKFEMQAARCHRVDPSVIAKWRVPHDIVPAVVTERVVVPYLEEDWVVSRPGLNVVFSGTAPLAEVCLQLRRVLQDATLRGVFAYTLPKGREEHQDSKHLSRAMFVEFVMRSLFGQLGPLASAELANLHDINVPGTRWRSLSFLCDWVFALHEQLDSTNHRHVKSVGRLFENFGDHLMSWKALLSDTLVSCDIFLRMALFVKTSKDVEAITGALSVLLSGTAMKRKFGRSKFLDGFFLHIAPHAFTTTAIIAWGDAFKQARQDHAELLPQSSQRLRDALSRFASRPSLPTGHSTAASNLIDVAHTVVSRHTNSHVHFRSPSFRDSFLLRLAPRVASDVNSTLLLVKLFETITAEAGTAVHQKTPGLACEELFCTARFRAGFFIMLAANSQRVREVVANPEIAAVLLRGFANVVNQSAPESVNSVFASDDSFRQQFIARLPGFCGGLRWQPPSVKMALSKISDSRVI